MGTNQDAKKSRPVTRRDFLKLGGAVSAGAILTACGADAASTLTQAPTQPAAPIPTEIQAVPAAAPCPAPPQPVLRIAHITDMHIDLSQKASEHFRRALRNIQTRTPEIDFVINTGDCVMDVMWDTVDSALPEWEAFHSGMKTLSLPVYHAIGNHDVLGWGLSADEQALIKDDPLFGKGMAVQQLGLPDRYYSFDQGGWHFIVLDSTHLAEKSHFQPYTGKLDDEQFEWLVKDIEATPASTPICVASHIPILCANELLDGNNEASGDWVLPGAWMHIDARRLWSLFWEHPNVKLCLSGHSHQVEDLRYHGVRYMNDGAICGNWWNGKYMDFPPGFVLVNLYADGTADNEFVLY